MTRAQAWVACCLMVAALSCGAEGLVVPAALWDRPRTAAVVLALPSVRQALNSYLAKPGSMLVIHHALGQDQLLEAEELRAWLMALAVDVARIRLLNDLRPGEPIVLEVTQ